VDQFTAAMRVVGLAEDTESSAGIAGLLTPVVTSVTLGPVPRLSVRPLPGQVAGDFERIADRIAAALRVHAIRVSTRPNGLIRLNLVEVDPLADVVMLPGPVSSVRHPVLLGRTDSGESLWVSLADIAHLVMQGQTRSGKSRWVYGLLAQLAGAPDVVIAGSDNTGVLLRPFTGSRHASWQALGADDLEEHVTVLEALVSEMNTRIQAIPARLDVLPVTSEFPVILAVVEEYSVLLELLGADDSTRGRDSAKLQARCRSAIRALLAGSAKVGMRVLLITQRADASGPASLGGFERGQASLRLTFRVDTREAVRMLHPGVPDAVANAHVSEPAGIALASGPELPCARLRSPHMPDYGTYADAVHAALNS
jgi:hypothetical protein